MVPVLETFTSYAATLVATTHTLSKPTGVVTGDLLMIIIGNDVGGGTGTWNALTGWTEEWDQNQTMGNWACFWREADGTEGSTIDVVCAASTSAVGFYLRISGADTAAPFDVKGTHYGNTTNTTSHVLTSATTTVDDCLGVYAFFIDGDTTHTVAGTGWTEQSDQASTVALSFRRNSGTFGTKSQATAGAMGNATVTSGISEQGAGMQFAIAPAAVSLTRTQEGYRWRNDDGSESAATWKESQDTTTEVPKETTIRLRLLTDYTGAATEQLKIQWRKQGDPASEWEDIS